jgi:2-amino-4-hydroxy-6-hydroxymethyldihydropteridine diphosphokinase
MSAADSIDLPPWAVAGEKRRAHIARVTALLAAWAETMRLPVAERDAWRDAGRWHDALRDASEAELRAMTGDSDMPAAVLHGPAAATRLASEGEAREDVLDAIRWHTTGRVVWARTGRALYMADFLEPGRRFDVELRADLAARVPNEFDAAFRSVVQHRIEWTMREGRALHEETARLWNAVR